MDAARNPVDRRLAELRDLTASGQEVLADAWSCIWDAFPAHVDAIIEVTIGATGPAYTEFQTASKAAARTLSTILAPLGLRSRSPLADGAWMAVLAELLTAELTAEQYQLMVAGLELALDTPAWWSDLGSRGLFCEMLAEGSDPATARTAVAALV